MTSRAITILGYLLILGCGSRSRRSAAVPARPDGARARP
jgi:hypothetical protein